MARRHVPALLLRVLLVLVTVAAVAGCSAPPTPAARPAPDSTEPGSGHVHGVELNPADGSLYAATHQGVFRLDPAGPVRVSRHRQDTTGFTVVGPDHFLASGHPGVDEPGPAHVGLTASSDGGRTWAAVALVGRADFHALSAAGVTVYGFEGLSAAVVRSDDGGQHWQRGASVEVFDLDVDPNGPMRVVAATRGGLQESLDGGSTFTALAAQSPRELVLIDHVAYVGGSDRDPPVRGGRGRNGVVTGDRRLADLWLPSWTAHRLQGDRPGPLRVRHRHRGVRLRGRGPLLGASCSCERVVMGLVS